MEIDKLIEKLFNDLNNNINNDGICLVGKHKLLYPVKQGKGSMKSRFSEQEIKQTFIRIIEEDGFYCYSVETPTEHKYRFSRFSDAGSRELISPTMDKGQSGNMDVSIYESSMPYDLLAHVEFKANQPNVHEISKDLLKLLAESNMKCVNYFVHALMSSDIGTWRCLIKKYGKAIDSIERNNPQPTYNKVVVFYIISLIPKICYKCELCLKDYKEDYKDVKISCMDDVKPALEKIFSRVSEIHPILSKEV